MSITSHSYKVFLWWELFRFTLPNFQVYNTVLLTTVTQNLFTLKLEEYLLTTSWDLLSYPHNHQSVLCFWVQFFFRFFYITEIIQHFFGLLQMAGFPFLWLNNNPCFVRGIRYIYLVIQITVLSLSFAGCLDGFRVLTTVNSAAVHGGVQVSFRDSD